jgi:hypothetical protein
LKGLEFGRGHKLTRIDVLDAASRFFQPRRVRMLSPDLLAKLGQLLPAPGGLSNTDAE